MHSVKYSLKGRVELVHLKRPVSKQCACGFLQYHKVLVTHGEKHVGEDVLARFDPIQDPKKKLPIGDFLTKRLRE